MWRTVEGAPVADRDRFSRSCLCSGLLFQPQSQGTALVLDHAWFGCGGHSMGAGVGWLAHLLALLQ